MHSFYLMIISTLLMLNILSCEGKKNESSGDVDGQLEAAARQLSEQASDRNSYQKEEHSASHPMAGRLKSILPEMMMDLKKTKTESKMTSDLGIMALKVAAEYQSADGKETIILSLTDLGRDLKISSLHVLSWYGTDVNRDSLDQIEHTTIYSGYRLFEQYYPDDRIGELQLIVAQRFLIDIDGYGVSFDALRKSLQYIDLKKVEGLKTTSEVKPN